MFEHKFSAAVEKSLQQQGTVEIIIDGRPQLSKVESMNSLNLGQTWRVASHE